ncbi:GerMN domain-containing protein [Bacillus methanolicus]|uniref:Spore germination protein GerM n=1 Tax=Bacillus methanolicus (strain MGA3 / ATCC 53907) TaxID=796606 RepID=I3ECQ6_BACMM|nr:GerMN domain-containing protein [Bacillus methanolicus]AIE60952.1 Spore germination protein GerM [Bacillus methanolicus MGA3]EIJ84277.1 germination protein gerM [Bacillus methanolicus MGA3]
MSINKKTTLVFAVFLLSVILSGCGLLSREAKKIDPPQDVSYLEEGETAVTKEKGAKEKETAGQEKAVEETVKTELYLIDKDGYVVPQTLALPKTKSVAKQALEYLVDQGPVSELLPNGFRAVLPADTKMTVKIKDGTAVVDFSKEFANYKPEDELKILQSITWTLTQFDSVQKVKIQMNGKELTEMPVNGTPISGELSRKDGINMDTTDVADITNSKAVTVYYLGGDEDSYYYVPVTRRVENTEKDSIVAAVSELIKGPGNGSPLLSEINPDAKLLDKPKMENGNVTLNFNDAIYGSFKDKMISQHVLNSLVLSLTEQKGIESVSIKVKGKTEIVNENGEKLTEPVSRPEKVNTGSF